MSSNSPFKIVNTGLSHSVVNDTHGFNHSSLRFWSTYHVELGQEIVSDSNQGVFRPPAEPIHSTAGNETREFESTRSELVSDL